MPYLGGTSPRWIALASAQRTATSPESAQWRNDAHFPSTRDPAFELLAQLHILLEPLP